MQQSPTQASPHKHAAQQVALCSTVVLPYVICLCLLYGAQSFGPRYVPSQLKLHSACRTYARSTPTPNRIVRFPAASPRSGGGGGAEEARAAAPQGGREASGPAGAHVRGCVRASLRRLGRDRRSRSRSRAAARSPLPLRAHRRAAWGDQDAYTAEYSHGRPWTWPHWNDHDQVLKQWRQPWPARLGRIAPDGTHARDPHSTPLARPRTDPAAAAIVSRGHAARG